VNLGATTRAAGRPHAGLGVITAVKFVNAAEISVALFLIGTRPTNRLPFGATPAAAAVALP
jgi:hypothetical protein